MPSEHQKTLGDAILIALGQPESKVQAAIIEMHVIDCMNYHFGRAWVESQGRCPKAVIEELWAHLVGSRRTSL